MQEKFSVREENQDLFGGLHVVYRNGFQSWKFFGKGRMPVCSRLKRVLGVIFLDISILLRWLLQFLLLDESFIAEIMFESDLIRLHEASDIYCANFIFGNIKEFVLIERIKTQNSRTDVNLIHLFVFALDVNLLIDKTDDLVLKLKSFMPHEILRDESIALIRSNGLLYFEIFV